MTTLILLSLLMLLLSAFFSGSEIAFVSANKLGIEVLKNKGHVKGKIIAGFYERPREFLSSMLVGNNIVLVLITLFMSKLIEPLLMPYFGEGSLVLLLSVTLIITLVVLIFGEFLPKTFSQLYSNEYLYRSALTIRFFMWLLYMPTWILTGVSNFIIRKVLKVPGAETDPVFSRHDLEEYINENISHSEDIDREILTNALNLGQVKVRDCMIPRNEIIYVYKTDTIDELVDLFRTHKISRIIVVDDDIENVVGYIHHQKLLYNPDKIEKIVSPVQFVPDAMGVKDLMQKFIKERFNIACVVDEYGGIAGLITLEDILEEIFGEIDDEHDVEEMTEEVLSDNSFLFAGRLEVDYLNEKYPVLELPEGDYQTLSGLVVKMEETIPEQGAEIIIGHNKIIVESVSDTRIEKIRIIRLHGDNE
ncbi:MAG: HlyC/CorC family transporter [Saprospiraceae bacterium]|nr:HlyC/CorC family transporter [Saprospiraceae bacterium]MBK7221631.1 HlyC/CorC family transporter [Saprospiraceae bacterium]MBK7788294.1 HlyC/CorC family transporter [Saprospiraceae bacterium]MBK8851509.1 HlyC/CorC family transporter [Saprospiraceae bacterium]MBL0084827.1 HlyC/CorC family transporter [Saprospiraceae bacterium]